MRVRVVLIALGFVETNGLGILNPGVSRSWGRARADISAVRYPLASSIDGRNPLERGLSRPTSKKICDTAVTSRLPTLFRQRPKSPILNSKLVGGPGFEPGASRSRNLGGLVQGDRFRPF